MLIAQVEPPQGKGGGDYYYRTFAPGVVMAEQDGVYVVNLTNVHRRRWDIFQLADVLVLKNICDPDFLPLIAMRRQNRRITVYEMADDLAAVQPWNPVYFFYKNPENLALIYRIARHCDAVQFSVPKLRELYAGLNPCCRVFPNQILDVPPQRCRPLADDLVIGWGGSHGHWEDMAEIAPALIEWVIKQRGVILHLMCSDPIWALFEKLPRSKKKRTEPGSLQDYRRFLNEIDIGIAPLKDTAFNRCRSDVKFLEYGVQSVVPVAASLEPYLRSVRDGVTGFLYCTPQELVRILDRLVCDTGAREATAQAARLYVLGERLQRDHRKERLDFYDDLVRATGLTDDYASCRTQFTLWSAMDGAATTGRHLQLEECEFESLLSAGLVEMQVEKNNQKAGRHFARAADLEPENYLPYLFGSSAFEDTMGALFKAIEKHPRSLRAWVLLGETFARQGKVREAMDCFTTATKVFPDYEIPYMRLGALLKQVGRNVESANSLEKAKSLFLQSFPTAPAP